jgi:hypothetical protein
MAQANLVINVPRQDVDLAHPLVPLVRAHGLRKRLDRRRSTLALGLWICEDGCRGGVQGKTKELMGMMARASPGNGPRETTRRH